MNYKFIFLSIAMSAIFYSCNKTNTENTLPIPSNTEIRKINPETFSGNEFFLTDIADNIEYIPLANSFLIGDIQSFKIINKSIYINDFDTLLVRFDRTGKNPQQIGRHGRGPGEYAISTFFTVDERTNKIYVHGRNYSILVFDGDGKFIKKIQLSEDTGAGTRDMEFLSNSNLFIAQNMRGSSTQYDWIVLDTLGNIVSTKKNSIPPFKTNLGALSGIFKHNGDISFWKAHSDTIFTISPDLDFQASMLFTVKEEDKSPSEMKNVSFQSLELFNDYYRCIYMIETNHYYLHKYVYQQKIGIVLIDKKDGDTFVSYMNVGKVESGGIDNNLDGGIMFRPEIYFVENGYEYLGTAIYPYELKAHVATEAFKNSTPKYPEKKKQLEQLANNLDENDNPVLMLVKLKE